MFQSGSILLAQNILPASTDSLQVTDTTDHRPPTTDYRLPTTDHRPPTTDHRLPTIDQQIDSIIALGKTLLNKPYRYRGSLPWQMDCSGYLKYIYGEFGHNLPHSSSAIGQVVRQVDLKDIRKGDFLFFKGRSTGSTHIGHVAMVIEVNDDGSVLMMHSTVRKGIIIEKYPSDYYYVPRFVKAGRLPAFDSEAIN